MDDALRRARVGASGPCLAGMAAVGARCRVTSVAALLAIAACLFACSSAEEGPAVDGEEVTAACGRCIFGMPEAQSLGCPWAVEVGGKHYLVQGQVPHGHQNHAPDGMCNMPRRAIVSGRVRGDRFIATRFDLLPAKNVPANPRFTDEDLH